jgi:ataxin-3
MASESWIYHEQQESALCGQHCLNNLLQNSVFSAPDLAEVAQELDRAESNLGGRSLISGNVDESGNFSLQVLRTALKRLYGMDLVSWSSEEGRGAVTDPTTENAFIVNTREHWYAIRKINGKWWDLNSIEERPVHISPFYLSALLGQLRADRSHVFLVVGKLPPSGDRNYTSRDETCWYAESRLLPASEARLAAPKPNPFSGAGRRLGDSAEHPVVISSSDVDEEDELQRAIRLSMEEYNASQVKVDARQHQDSAKSEKEIMREKRLQALSKK